MADQRSPGYHLKTILMAVAFVVALAAGVAILSFGLTHMFGVRKRPDQTAIFSVGASSHHSTHQSLLA